jgi:pimeloyl-ACP methyl ester carboxylesterase
MSTFIFVHGAWCWEKVAPLLWAAGHEVFAPDLPGQGDDRTPIDGLTLGDWIDSVAGLIESRPDKVVLVVQPAGRRIVWPLCNSRPLQGLLP